MLKLRRAAAVALAAGTALAAMTGVGSAAASPAHSPSHITQLRGDYLTPLQFAVDGRRIYVADGARSALFRLGNPHPLATGPTPSKDPENSGDLAGVDARHGTVAFTTTNADHRNTYLTVLRHGKQVLKVNLGRYERQHNPDGAVTYGAVNPAAVPAACSTALATMKVPVQYTGMKDSHPYAVAALWDGSWLVADAGGNDILRVSPHGHISTVAILPVNRMTITAQLAAGLGAPACEGVDYRFEGVPTDVEVTRSGVYVSALGGAPEVGAVYRMGDHGRFWKLAGGIPGATNIAVTSSGCVFVVELGKGVFEIRNGSLVKAFDLPGAAAVEWSDGRLYASTAPAALSQGGTPPMGHIYRLQ